jgi:hypothetical protein
LTSHNSARLCPGIAGNMPLTLRPKNAAFKAAATGE